MSNNTLTREGLAAIIAKSGLSVTDFAPTIHMKRRHLHRLLAGESPITPQTAIVVRAVWKGTGDE